MLAESDAGYRNLVKLTSAGFLEGFARGKPSVDMDLLSSHSEGVIALTGCLQSRFCQRLIDDRPEDARAHLDDMAEVFGADNIYFEVQENGIDVQNKANQGIARFARELGRPLIATADVHYLRREDYTHHAALLCVQTKSTLENPKLSFEHERVLLEVQRRDGRVLLRLAGFDRVDLRGRRALQRGDRARQAAAAAVSDPGRRGAGGDAPPAG